MTEAAVLDILRQALWTALIVSTPILAVALVVGLAIGLVQALTSVQEMTLTFVPKLGAILAVFWVTMSFSGADAGALLPGPDHPDGDRPLAFGAFATAPPFPPASACSAPPRRI